MLATIKIHALGIFFGVLAILAVYFVLQLFAPKTEEASEVPVVYTVVDKEQVFEVLKLSATKALQRSVNAKRAFPLNEICESVSDLAALDELELTVPKTTNVGTELFVPLIAGSIDEAGKAWRPSADLACSEVQALSLPVFVMSSSAEVWKELKEKGVTLEDYAVATSR